MIYSIDNNVKSRLMEPTAAYKKKKEATLNDKQKKLQKKQKEMQKMMAQSRFVTGLAETPSLEFTADTRESSPTIEVKDYPRAKYEGGGSVNRTNTEQFGIQASTRKKRKDRNDKINYEKSPVNLNSNRYMVKHTYTKLEHDAAGPRFKVIK